VKLPKPKAKGRPKPSASAERDPDYRTLADGRAEPPLLCRKPTGERLKLSDRLLRLMRAWYARGIFDGNGKPLDAAAEAFERAARLEPPSLLASHFSAVAPPHCSSRVPSAYYPPRLFTPPFVIRCSAGRTTPRTARARAAATASRGRSAAMLW